MLSSNHRNWLYPLYLYGAIFSLLVSLTACRMENPTGDPVDQVTAQVTAAPTQTVPITQPPEAARTPSLRTPTASPAVSPTPQPVSTLEVEPSNLKGVTVQFWHTWDGEAEEVIRGLVEGFNAANEWGVQVQAVYQGNYDGMARKVEAAIPEGALPDLVVAFPYQALDWEETAGTGPGVETVDLNEYVNEPTWGLSADEQADFYPVFWEQDVVGEKRLGIPAQRSAQLLYYNLTWAKALGFDKSPSTLEEFKTQACAAAQANRQDDSTDNDGTGGWIVSTDYPAVTGWMYAFGGEILQSGGSGYRFDTPQTEATFHYLRELYDQGCAWVPQSDPPETEFAGRSGLFAVGTLAGIPHQSLVFERLGSQDEWTVLPFPSPQGQPVISVYGPSFEIVKSTPERQLAAWLFVKWLALPENQAQLAQATGSFPLRRSAQTQLDAFAGRYPQWASAQELIQYAHSEPALRSWDTVRWAVSDAATQLFRYYFTTDQVPTLVELLDETAAELNSR